MSEPKGSERRRHIRFTPSPEDQNDLYERSLEAMAHIDLDGQAEDFNPQMMGLLGDQSHAGCSVAFMRKNKLAEKLVQGHLCQVKAGRLHPMKATVRWREDMDEDFFKIGFQFLE